MWRKRNPCTFLVGMKISAIPIKNSMKIPQKLKIELSYDPAIPLLGLYLKKMKSLCQRDISITAFTAAALFKIAKT